MIEGKAAGLTVSIGARVAAHAGASEVLVSQTVKDLVAGQASRSKTAVSENWQAYPTAGACIE